MKLLLMSLVSFFAVSNVSFASQDFGNWPGMPSMIVDDHVQVEEFTAYVDIRYSSVYTCQAIGCSPSHNIYKLFLAVPVGDNDETMTISTSIASYDLVNKIYLPFNNVLMTNGHIVHVRGAVKYHDNGSAELVNIEQMSFLN